MPAKPRPELPIGALFLTLLTTEELARAMRFDQPTASFYRSLRDLGIRSVKGRSGVYDPVHVRARLDLVRAEAAPANLDVSPAASALQRRRTRRAQV